MTTTAKKRPRPVPLLPASSLNHCAATPGPLPHLYPINAARQPSLHYPMLPPPPRPSVKPPPETEPGPTPPTTLQLFTHATIASAPTLHCNAANTLLPARAPCQHPTPARVPPPAQATSHFKRRGRGNDRKNLHKTCRTEQNATSPSAKLMIARSTASPTARSGMRTRSCGDSPARHRQQF